MVGWKEARCRVGQVEGAGGAENMLMWSGRCGSSGWSIASRCRACGYRRERRVHRVQVNGCMGSDGEDRRRRQRSRALSWEAERGAAVIDAVGIWKVGMIIAGRCRVVWRSVLNVVAGLGCGAFGGSLAGVGASGVMGGDGRDDGGGGYQVGVGSFGGRC